MSKIRKKYTKAEKLEIVSLSLDPNEEVKELAERYGVHEQTLYKWRSQYSKHEDAAFPGKGNKTMTETERKISELERDLKEARLECEILKKAVGIFSKRDRKYSNL